MTIQCEDCGEIPLNYRTINNRNLCMSCARKEYLQRLKELKKEFPVVSNYE